MENYLGKSLSAGQSASISSWITAVQRYIDNYTHCKFEQVVGETRYFDGNGLTELVLDEFISLTSVTVLEVDGTTLQTLTEGDDQDFITYPYNETTKFRIILQPSSAIGYFPSRRKSVKIVGTWNNSTAVPADIELVANMLLADMISDAGSNGKEIASESLGGYSISYNNNASIDETAARLGIKQLLDQYVIYEL